VHRLQTLSAAYELEIFQILATGPVTPAELATRHGFDLRATEVVLTMLGALGLVRARGSAYELTDVSRTLSLA
jgi:DNA-binding IclR family transcriptional regulator